MSCRFVRFAMPIACALLAGCGLTSSPADNLTFSPPSGWKGSPGIMGYMQFWKSPHTGKEVLMLIKSPKPFDQHDAFSSAKLNDATVEQRRSIRICGDQPAEYLLARGDSSSMDFGTSKDEKSSDSDVQMVVTTTAGATYMAMYIYPVGQQPDSQASAALRELCAKS